MNFAQAKRSPTEQQRRRVASLMKRLQMGFRTRFDQGLSSKNVTSAQIRLLYEVRGHPGATGAQIARACFVTPQSAQAMLARGVQRGWVERGKDPENSRLVTAQLTPAGERLLQFADEVFRRIEAEVWSGVPLAQLRAAGDLLERGLANL
jgi:DNA-binding MarR family transcriptional regulator